MASICPRCGAPAESAPGRGRRRKWCSDTCRRRASEERQAARRQGAPVEVRELIRERIIERSRPMTPDGAVERVLHSDEATLRLLRVLAHRMTHDPPQDSTARFHHSKYLPPIHDLWQAYHEADSGRLVPPPPVEQTAAAAPPPAGRATAHKEATALVLSSPRSLREVLTTLADQARSGELARGEHAGTVAAARDLLQALIANRILHL